MPQKCSVKGCTEDADCEVVLYDVYSHDGSVFFKQDFTCPFICQKHILENEQTARGERKPRGVTYYKYTNQQGAQGFSIYRPLNWQPKEVKKD